MTTLDHFGLQQIWPLTGTSRRKRRRSIESDLNTQAGNRIQPHGRPRLLRVGKLHTIRIYRASVACHNGCPSNPELDKQMKTNISKCSSFIMSCLHKDWQIFGGLKRIKCPEPNVIIIKLAVLFIYGVLLFYRGSCFHEYIMNYAKLRGHCKWT